MRLPSYTGEIVGLLLAAGRGRRFDSSGMHNKLLQPVPTRSGRTVLASAVGNLAAALPTCVVLRSDEPDLVDQIGESSWVKCGSADDGMAASLVCGLQQTVDAAGWVIALGDMPYVQTVTIQVLAAALRGGADIAVPAYAARRGNPVGFSRLHLPNLLALRGDRGARSLLQSFPVVEVEVEDSGIHQDIDVVADIRHS